MSITEDHSRCPCCGQPFAAHLGVIGMCRKWLNVRCELESLIKECDSAMEFLRNELGSFEVNTSLESLQNQIARAKRIAKDSDTGSMRNSIQPTDDILEVAVRIVKQWEEHDKFKVAPADKVWMNGSEEPDNVAIAKALLSSILQKDA